MPLLRIAVMTVFENVPQHGASICNYGDTLDIVNLNYLINFGDKLSTGQIWAANDHRSVLKHPIVKLLICEVNAEQSAINSKCPL